MFRLSARLRKVYVVRRFHSGTGYRLVSGITFKIQNLSILTGTTHKLAFYGHLG